MTLIPRVTLTLVLAAAPPSAPDAGDDPYTWLEDVAGPRSMEWVKAENAVTQKELASTPAFEHLRTQLLEVLDSDARIPDVVELGTGLYYNFWKDHDHPRGLWRRTTLAEYRKPNPAWEDLIDLDALGKAEKERWVWHGYACLKPEYRHCMIFLSRGGADASVAREYDLKEKAFVKGGFALPEAKLRAEWIDADNLYVMTDFGPGTMTKSSYARQARRWKRGTPLSAAALVHEVSPDDMMVEAEHDATPGFERDFVTRVIDFFSSETFLIEVGGKLRKLEVPLDAEPDVHREWILVKLRTAWSVGGKTFPGGSLLAERFDDFLSGKRDFAVVFAPDASTTLSGYSWTRHHLLLNELRDVVSRTEVLTPEAASWKRELLEGAEPLTTRSAAGADRDVSDEYFVRSEGFLTPNTLSRGVFGEAGLEVLKRNPAFFDAQDLAVQQHFARSADGTRVPYFVVGPKDLQPTGKHPTQLTGYGGFELSLSPSYNGRVGRGWLAAGGVYVVANIRGGGEYGPAWHTAALKENRPRAYEDFAAVAQDLIAQKVTDPAHLGTLGGSNGGLLMGNMLTRYPQLFGAIACLVPLLDMKRYTHLSAGSSWIAEYGDPDKPEEWSFLQRFSAYQNVDSTRRYPPILFVTSTRDDRVGPVHARKMAAKMLAAHQGEVRFYENIEGGHGAAADNAQAAFMNALEYTFLWNHVR